MATLPSKNYIGVNNNHLFSVIIPTYHRNDLLAKCLDCLAPGVQTLPADQYEVIVTDDGSQTTAEEMIRQQYPWVKWVAGPCKGPAANRNNGAKHAKGKWLVFTDDDCVPTDQWLEAYVEAIITDIYVYEGQTTCNAGIRSPLEHAPINLTGGYFWSCNLIIDIQLFEKLKGFDENFPYPHLEDVEFRDRIKALDQQAIFVERAIVDHPPRIAPWGNKLANYHESDIYYWFCKKNEPISQRKLIITIIKYRIRAIAKHRLSSHTFKALFSTLIEIIYVFFKFNLWKEKLKKVPKNLAK
ncbi:glycosyltransferase family 2 protein [Nostoc sp.]|uniref:glycosyltransferase family 2 protein n=1 Tax=Nostoc sp. TaxID=1180 RepID=UPI002FFBCF57